MERAAAAPPAAPPAAAAVAPSRLRAFWRRHEAILLPVAVAAGAKLAMLALAFLVLYPRQPMFDGFGFSPAFAERWSWFWHQIAVAWDGEHYLCIARDGFAPPSFYYSNPDGVPHNCNSVHWAPVYPGLIWIFGAADAVAPLVNSVCSLVAVAVIAAHLGRRPAMFFALFPSWLVFGTVSYAEGVYVMFAALMLVALDRGWQLAGGLWGALAAATRYVGGPALLAAAIPWSSWCTPRRWVTAAIVAAAGAALWIYLWLWTGHFSGYTFAQEPWGNSIDTPWGHFVFLSQGWFTNQNGGIENGNTWALDTMLRDLWFLAPFIWGLTMLWRRGDGRRAFVYSAVVLVLVMCTSGTSAATLPRYMLAGYPALAIVGERLTSRGAWWTYGTLGVVGGAYGLSHYLVGFWS